MRFSPSWTSRCLYATDSSCASASAALAASSGSPDSGCDAGRTAFRAAATAWSPSSSNARRARAAANRSSRRDWSPRARRRSRAPRRPGRAELVVEPGQDLGRPGFRRIGRARIERGRLSVKGIVAAGEATAIVSDGARLYPATSDRTSKFPATKPRGDAPRLRDPARLLGEEADHGIDLVGGEQRRRVADTFEFDDGGSGSRGRPFAPRWPPTAGPIAHRGGRASGSGSHPRAPKDREGPRRPFGTARQCLDRRRGPSGRRHAAVRWSVSGGPIGRR